MKIISAQTNPIVGDINSNAEQILTISQRAVTEFQADLVLFPELAICGYPPEDFLFRQDFLQACLDACRRIQDANLPTTIVVGLPLQVGQQLYNSALVIQDGNIICRYNKQLLPNYKVFDERRYFAHGHDNGVFSIKQHSIGLLICEDVWQPGPVQNVASASVDFVVCINASPFTGKKLDERRSVLEQRVQETQLPLIYTNCIGGQDELVFDGGSTALLPNGDSYALPAFQEALQVIELDLHKQTLTSEIQPLKPLPVPLQNDLIGRTYQALVLGVKDYVRKNGFKSVLLGLSGGIDSALTLAIAVDALGADHVIAVRLPSKYTSQLSLDLATEQAELLGCECLTIDIHESTLAAEAVLVEAMQVELQGLTGQNLQARIRGDMLMALSNQGGQLVLTTSNKSEMAVGYSTLYGDMAGAFCVLKDVVKTHVYALARYRNSIELAIPEAVIDRPPTAELADNQLDQDSLPVYEVLDEIIQRYLEQDQSIDHIVQAGFDAEVVNRVIRLIYRSEYKRRQSAPGPRVTARNFGKDRRYPITQRFV